MPKHNPSKKDLKLAGVAFEVRKKVFFQQFVSHAQSQVAAQEKAEQEKAAQEAAKAKQEKAEQEKAEQEKAAQEAAKAEQEEVKAEQEDTALDQDFDVISDDISDDAFGQPSGNAMADFTQRENETGTKTQSTQVANGSQSWFSSVVGFFGLGKQVAQNSKKLEQDSPTPSSPSVRN